MRSRKSARVSLPCSGQMRKSCAFTRNQELVRAGEGGASAGSPASARVRAFHELFAGLSVQGQNHLYSTRTGSKPCRVANAWAGLSMPVSVRREPRVGIVRRLTQLIDGVVEECAAGAPVRGIRATAAFNYTGIFVVGRVSANEDGGEGAVILGDKETRRGEGVFAQCLCLGSTRDLPRERRDAVMAGNLLRKGIESFQQLFR